MSVIITKASGEKEPFKKVSSINCCGPFISRKPILISVKDLFVGRKRRQDFNEAPV